MGARSVAAIVIQSTIEILVGGDLILLGLVLRQVALPLEAVAYGRRSRPAPRPGVVFLPGLRLG